MNFDFFLKKRIYYVTRYNLIYNLQFRRKGYLYKLISSMAKNVYKKKSSYTYLSKIVCPNSPL